MHYSVAKKMLTGAIPEEYRRVTGCAHEGNRKVTGRLPEHTGGLPECTGGLPEVYQRVTGVCARVPTKRVLRMGGIWWVTGGR